MRRTFTLVCLLLASLRAASGAAAVWIDTDVAIGSPLREIDDGFALAFAIHSPEIRIVGISTTYGNAGVNRTTAVARGFVRRFDPHLQVFRGAAAAGEFQRETEASAALARALRKERLTYVALGPLTNLASFVTQHPAEARRIERVLFVGGRSPDRVLRFGPTGAMRIHDANVFKDPAAARKILRTKIPLVLTPVETSAYLLLRPNERRELRGGTGRFLRERSGIWMWFFTALVREQGGPLFDLLPMLELTRPRLLRNETRSAAVDSAGDLIAARQPQPGARAVRFCTGFVHDPTALVRHRLSDYSQERNASGATVSTGAQKN
ncbi:MAG: nucleoside hydrolase [Chthoniobacterales bacterium]